MGEDVQAANDALQQEYEASVLADASQHERDLGDGESE